MNKEDYKAAIDCQNACNLSGVVHTFDETLPRIWGEARKLGKGTDWVNTHPISLLFADKIFDLSCRKVSDLEGYSKAYEECLQKAK